MSRVRVGAIAGRRVDGRIHSGARVRLAPAPLPGAALPPRTRFFNGYSAAWPAVNPTKS